MPSLSFGLLAALLLSGLFSTTAGLPSGRPVSVRAAFTRSGFFTDTDAAHRALAANFKGDDTMTVEMCAEYCSAYQFFGLEYGRECYCGNEQIYTNDGYTPPTPPAAPAGAPYLGCFVDAAERVLPYRIISEDDMTAANCAANCEGYAYFGTQWSRECYYGNTAPTEAAPKSDCSMACSGDATEMCGAGMRLSVYGPVITAPPPIVGTTNPAAVGNFVYGGCYTDSIDLRVLSRDTISNTDITLMSCATICAGYTHCVEYSTQCFCGIELDPSGVKSPETDCTMKCPGDHSLICGDANRLTVYKKVTTPAAPSNPAAAGDFKYQSCWIDAVGDRSLTDKTEASTEMTVEMCAAFRDGYTFFGVEYSAECYCGNEGRQLRRNAATSARATLRSGAAVPTVLRPISTDNPEITSSARTSTDVLSTDVSSTAFNPPTSTVADETSTITPGPKLATVTSCPLSSTLVAGQTSCYWKLPDPCIALSRTDLDWWEASMSVDQCTMSLGFGFALLTPAASCFPSWFDNGDEATAIYSCMESVGLGCTYASDCATNTYTVGQEPSTTTPSTPVPTNPVIQNTGFETGTKDSWTLDSSFNTEDISNVCTHSGKFAYRAIYLNDNGRSTQITQDVQLTPGGNYTLSIWVSHDNPANSWCGMSLYALRFVEWADIEMSFMGVPAATWQKINVDFQAAASWATLSVYFYCGVAGPTWSDQGKNTLYFDDIELMSRDV
ncbi:hypothetical protein VTI74DRAFT_3475 [Chaetomium olivicolor]